ncbi:MAG: hypothetical protein VKI42_08150 [Synechococcaceae cyanobacterium]|nr:hypothetical protein [Synechococcaceae cyanobacterium]
MAAGLTLPRSLWQRPRPPLWSLGALLAVLPLALATTPAHAAGAGSGSFVAAGTAPPAQRDPQPDAQSVSRAYPAPVRQAYPYPSNPGHQPLPLGQPAVLPLSMDPLAVCPSNLLTFLNNSTNRAVPLWVAARSCDCYAQERAEGTTQELSSRRCFP